MTAHEPTRLNLVMAWLVLALTVILIALGIAWHGFSADVHYRFWQDIYDRPGGPLSFRFLLQPVMALIVALHDGIGDARLGRTPYLHALLTNPMERGSRLGEGLLATARIVLLGLSMDVIYQLKVFDTFYPVEALVIAALLAFVPYVLLRGPAARVARWWFGSARSGSRA